VHPESLPLANLVLLELLEPMDKLVLLELKEKQVPKEKMVWMHSRDLPAKKDLLANLDFEDLLAKKEPLANLVCPDTTESQETRHPLAWRDNKDPLALMVNKDVWVSKDPLVKPARKAGKEKRDLKDHKEEMERMESLENEEKKDVLARPASVILKLDSELCQLRIVQHWTMCSAHLLSRTRTNQCLVPTQIMVALLRESAATTLTFPVVLNKKMTTSINGLLA